MDKTFDILSGKAAVIIPFWDDGQSFRMQYLNQTLSSILEQTDTNINIYIVDDCSGYEKTRENLEQLSDKHPNLFVLYAPENKGPGVARNLGIARAYQDGCPFISFLDADDMFDKDRIRQIRQTFINDSKIDIIYTNFIAVDEENVPVSTDNLVESIKQIQNYMKSAPLEGYDVWKELAVTRDTLTIPSALSVRTELAYKVPFPKGVRFHEDSHTWLRYSAYGANVKYLDGVETRYRVPQKSSAGSESRERAGGRESFNRLGTEVITDGLNQALNYAVDRNIITENDKDYYRVRLLLNLASIIEKEDTPIVVKELLVKAEKLSKQIFDENKNLYGF